MRKRLPSLPGSQCKFVYGGIGRRMARSAVGIAIPCADMPRCTAHPAVARKSTRLNRRKQEARRSCSRPPGSRNASTLSRGASPQAVRPAGRSMRAEPLSMSSGRLSDRPSASEAAKTSLPRSASPDEDSTSLSISRTVPLYRTFDQHARRTPQPLRPARTEGARRRRPREEGASCYAAHRASGRDPQGRLALAQVARPERE